MSIIEELFGFFALSLNWKYPHLLLINLLFMTIK